MTAPKFTLTPEQLHALHAGDRRVFQLIFAEFQPRLYRFLWLKLRNVQHAEDLVQETFLRLWKARTQLRAETRLTTYLFRIAANLATDFFRRTSLPTAPLETIIATLPAPSALETTLEHEQLAQAVNTILATMPDGPRTAFVLSRYEDLAYAEIAEVMGLSLKTVEKHLGKALLVLRAKLEEQGWSK